MKKLPLLLSTMALALMADPAHAEVSIQFTQDSAGVTANVQGSIDPSSFRYFGQGYFPTSYFNAGLGAFYVSEGPYDMYIMPPGNLSAFGDLSTVKVANSSSGTFGFDWNGSNGNPLYLPVGYVANSPLSASMFFSGASFASLGITPTDFSHDLGSGQIVNFAFNTTSAVPEPATWGMMIAGFGLMGAALRRRKATVRFA